MGLSIEAGRALFGNQLNVAWLWSHKQGSDAN